MTAAISTSRSGLALSPKGAMPITATPAAPSPVKIANAVPTGSCFKAIVSSAMAPLAPLLCHLADGERQLQRRASRR